MRLAAEYRNIIRSDGSAGHPVPRPGQHLQLGHCQRPQGRGSDGSGDLGGLLYYPCRAPVSYNAVHCSLRFLSIENKLSFLKVFGVLAEYALILKIIQSEKRRDAKVRSAPSKL